MADAFNTISNLADYFAGTTRYGDEGSKGLGALAWTTIDKAMRVVDGASRG